METIKIVRAGAVDEAIISGLRTDLSLAFDKRVVVDSGTVTPPDSAFVPAKRQYSAQKFLDRQGLRIEEGVKVLCITDVDLFLPGLNFIFGLTDEFRPFALVSTARFGVNIDLVTERTVKTSVHELGHLYGLRHCSNPRCVMFFSYTLADTDYKETHYCDRCRRVLEKKTLTALTL